MMSRSIQILIISYLFIITGCQMEKPKTIVDVPKMKALIIDGENNHGVWPKTTMMMKDYLEETGLFTIDIARTAYTWSGPHYDESIGLEDIKELLTMYPIDGGPVTTSVEEPRPDPNFNPEFSDYDVIISNMGWKASSWPQSTKDSFVEYMSNGGGLIVVHAANNSWGDWPEYNEMIGLGGWGGRKADEGFYTYYNDEGSVVLDSIEGNVGSHGPQHEYPLQTRASDHPIMKGLPASWLHTRDELYDRLRGPATNMTVLATAYSDVVKNSPPWAPEVPGTGRHEPMLMTINYGKGRVFHTGLGHMDYSMECVGFITTFQRGAEWVATGKVTQKVPEDFPGTEKTSSRKWLLK